MVYILVSNSHTSRVRLRTVPLITVSRQTGFSFIFVFTFQYPTMQRASCFDGSRGFSHCQEPREVAVKSKRIKAMAAAIEPELHNLHSALDNSDIDRCREVCDNIQTLILKEITHRDIG
jgi:hypothetical protein